MNPLPFELYPITIAGALNLLLGALLMTLNVNHRANRAFATVMILRAGSHTNFGFAAMFPEEAEPIRRVFVPIGIWIVAALSYFLCVYPRPRAWLPRGWRAMLLFALPAAALTLVAMGPARAAFAPMESEWFLVLTVGASMLFGIAALVLFREAMREPPGLARTSMLLMSLGFTGVATQDLVGTYLNGALRPGGPETPLLHAIGALWGVVALAQLALVLRHVRERSAQAALAVVAVSATLAFATQAPGTVVGPVGQTLGAGIARLLLPILTAYALLRYQIFDLDVRFRRGFGKGLVPGAFVLLFFAVSEGAELVVSSALGAAFGLLAALLLLFALRPLERAADAFSRRLLPVTDPALLDVEGRASLYRELVRTAHLDGAPGEGERRVLAAARAKLRIDEDEGARLEREAVAS